MDNLIRKYIPKSAPCDHPFSISGLIVIGIFVEIILILGSIKANNLFSQIFCLTLLPLPILIGLKGIRQVTFDSSISIKPIIGKTKTIEYSQLRKFYKHDLGKYGMFIWVLKYDQNNKQKKITFYDDDLNFEEFREVLKILKTKSNSILQ